MYLILKVFYRFLSKIFRFYFSHFSETDNSLIVFEGRPDFSDNPKALCEFILNSNELKRKYRVLFFVKDHKKMTMLYPEYENIFITYDNKYKSPSFRALKTLYSAKYTFASHSFFVKKNEYRTNQCHVLLWHGCGYKDKTGCDGMRNFDYALVPGPLFIETKKKFWNTTAEYICSIGYPRYDWFKKPSSKACDFMCRLKANFEKIIVWMPTFRNSKTGVCYAENEISSFPLINDETSWKKLDAFCETENILLVVKLHMSQKDYAIDFKKMTNVIQIGNDDFEQSHVNMYECLCYTDALISDYSSIAFDYLMLDKPIAFALDDFNLYKDLRGFIFSDPKSYMPGHHLYGIDDLLRFICDVKEENDCYKKERAVVKAQTISESNHYCKDLIDYLGM